ncbi:tetratricopeptide repeat protein [Chondromyces apiculatus]|uniref:Sel1-like repeat protein n=1 Tax=Chondromyces apiculatus DSM 436 TaxID=1192034 RepID=A0A017TDW1_9BACT|nr:tetratricopeptide repeat protein [Chondromyces apiculatus]EYF06995.1 Sel1-like repeat protein [Chondromyces apiculatus DSM 436]
MPQATVAAEARVATPAEPEAPPSLPFHLPCEATDLVGCTDGCAAHHVEDCVTLGAMYLRGDVVSIDTERATGLFREACSVDSARGCLLLGDAYHAGLLQGAEEETVAYRRSCEAGANLGCLATGRAYLEGRGVGADAVFAAQLFRRVCALGNAPACVELGHLHAHGEGVPRDQDKALELYTKACKLGLDEGCLLASHTGEVLPPRE